MNHTSNSYMSSIKSNGCSTEQNQSASFLRHHRINCDYPLHKNRSQHRNPLRKWRHRIWVGWSNFNCDVLKLEKLLGEHSLRISIYSAKTADRYVPLSCALSLNQRKLYESSNYASINSSFHIRHPDSPVRRFLRLWRHCADR